jgi:hypothetical protein
MGFFLRVITCPDTVACSDSDEILTTTLSFDILNIRYLLFLEAVSGLMGVFGSISPTTLYALQEISAEKPGRNHKRFKGMTNILK